MYQVLKFINWVKGFRKYFYYFYLILIALFLFSLPLYTQALISNLDASCWLCDSPLPGVYGTDGKVCEEPVYQQSPTGQNCQLITCRDHPDCVKQFESYKQQQVQEPIEFKLNIPIPGLKKFSQGKGVVVTNETLLQYIGGLYRFFIGIAGILAVVMISIGGLLWLFSGGSPDKISKAKEIILGAVGGLILALGSYLILYTINPKLVTFQTLPLPPVVRIQFFDESKVCPSESLVQNIPTSDKLIISSSASDPRLIPATISKLQQAASQVNGLLVITDAYRQSSGQSKLYNCYLTKVERSLPAGQCPAGCSSCNEAAAPSCEAPHQTGKAVDVCLQNRPGGIDTCQHISADCNGGACLTGSEADKLRQEQIYLQQKMAEAGFSRYCGEWWHFEDGAMSRACAPGQY